MLAAHDPPPLGVWLVFAGFVGLVLWWHFTHRRRAATNLRALAQRLGFDCIEHGQEFGSPKLLVTGRRDGREVQFFMFSTGAGKSRVNWRAVSVRPRTIGGLLFHFRPQGLGTKLSELLGAKEITVGDAAFDAAWFIQTNEPEFLRAALVPEVRAKLMAARADAGTDGNFKLQQAAVVYAEHGMFDDPNDCARFEQLLPVLHDLADIAEVSAERSP
jgi:hypothetical protein